MSRATGYYISVFLIVVLTAMVFGRAGWVTTEAPIVISNIKAQAKGGTTPFIAFPPPLLEPLESATLPAAPGTRSDAAESPEIVPGGAVSGQAVVRMWEINANQTWQVRSAPLTPPNWFITGVVKRGDQTQIIIQFDGEPQPRFFKIGDVLPGGGKLGWVKPDAIGVITPTRKKLSVALRANETAATPIKPTGR